MRTIRHSFAGRWVRQTLHAVYSFQNRDGRPVGYHLAAGVDIQLYPEGEIAEFLTVQRFFEKTEMAQTASYLKPGMKVIDVGANIGVYSILAQRQVGDTGFVWAFEPSSESYRRLLKNLALNKCSRVQPAQIALSNRSDTALVLQSDPGFGDAYRYLLPLQEASGAGGEIVPAITLDLYASRNGVTSVDFIKVDVEGFEYMVFSGSQDLLASSPKVVVMFESDPGWCARAGCRQQDSFELFRKLDFQLYAWNGKKRKWTGDEPSLLGASTVWASRDLQALPLL
jgi:FkbM family methyltransferase